METILEFNINSSKDTDFAFVHIMRHGAKVCLHFPKLNIGERVERFNTYQEAESYALRINANKNMIDIDDVVLATVDTSVYHLDENRGLMTGAFIIKDAYGNVLDNVIFNPDDNEVRGMKNLGLTSVAEIRTVIYMLEYIKQKGYKNVVVNYDNLQIRKSINCNQNILTRSESILVNELRDKIKRLGGHIIFQHLKSHTGHRTLDAVDKMARNANIARNKIQKKETIIG